MFLLVRRLFEVSGARSIGLLEFSTEDLVKIEQCTCIKKKKKKVGRKGLFSAAYENSPLYCSYTPGKVCYAGFVSITAG